MTDLTPLGKAVVLVVIGGIVALVFVLVLGCSQADDETPPKPTCDVWCDRSVGCDGDPDPMCLEECNSIRAKCPHESKALLTCLVQLPDSALWCDKGTTQWRRGQCADEDTAAASCWTAGGK